MSECKCGNEKFGFDCVCEHVKNNSGDTEYICEFCGMYAANKPRCNKCEINEECLKIEKDEFEEEKDFEIVYDSAYKTAVKILSWRK